MKKLLLLLLFLWFNSYCLFSADVNAEVIKKLQSKKPAIRLKISTLKIDYDKKLVIQLVLIAKEDPKKEYVFEEGKDFIIGGEPYTAKEMSILLLGEMRAVEAVPYLISEIAYISNTYHKPLNLTRGHHSLSALVKIGKPASKYAIMKIQKVDQKELIQLLTVLIKAVEGEDVGKYLLNKALSNAKDKKSKERLKKAIAMKDTNWYMK